MARKSSLIFLIGLLFCSIYAKAQKDSTFLAKRMDAPFKKLLLELSTTYFTVVKENQVDLDSSLIHVSRELSLSRLPILADGIENENILNNAGWVDQRKPWVGQKQLTRATKHDHAALSILLGAYFAFEPGNNIKTIKSGMTYLQNGINESVETSNNQLKLAGQRLMAKLYLKNENLAEADKLFNAVGDAYFKSGKSSAAATTYLWWGLYAPVTPYDTKPRINHTETASQIFKTLDDKEGQIDALINDCYLHLLINDLKNAEIVAKKAVNLTSMVHFPYAHYVTAALMTTSMFQGKFGEPLTYTITNIESAQKMNDFIALPYFEDIVAGLYYNEGNREDIAINWQKKSVDIFLRQHERSGMGVGTLVDMLMHNNRQTEARLYLKKINQIVPPVTTFDSLFYNLTLGSYYIYTSQWASAHRVLNNAVQEEKNVETHGLSVRKPDVLIALATLNYKEGNFKVAKTYYEQYLSLQAIGNGGLHGDNALALEALIKIDSIAGDQKSQLEDYRRFTEATIRNYKVSKIMLAEELQVKYATSARINQIKLLNQKELLEQENLRQANVTKNITIAGVVLLLIIALLLYRQGEIRKKNNEITVQKNELMQKLLDEKEWLLKEIHHRVKNNLHTIACLLESQAIYLENDALKAIENSRHRIYVMSLIHQKLYQSDDIKMVNMKTYLTEFVAYLKESFGEPASIELKLEVEEIKMSAGQAIPIGLIVNEAITNAFKYAFPAPNNGVIKVVLKKIKDEIYLLVSDNGVGFEKSDQEVNSLGLELIKGLSLDLGSNLSLETDNGTTIKIRFKYDSVEFPEGDRRHLV